MRVTFTITLLLLLLAACSGAQNTASVSAASPWSRQIADSFLLRHPGAVTYDSGSPSQKWNYEQGVMLLALYQQWLHTNDSRYLKFVEANLDQYVEENGSIKTYKLADYNCDNVCPGRTLIEAFNETGSNKFRFAADTLRAQLAGQPRTNEGGFWHKKIYPNQMWLDGLFMAEPFYAMYAKQFNQPAAFDDIANQFLWLVRHTRDPKTGLLYHGWDESKQQKWANPQTGCSPSFWGRSMGWYAMGLIDVLDYFPADHPKRDSLIALLKDWSAAILKYRDQQSGLWYLVVDRKNAEGNYLEASASCMYAYVFAKGVNKGYLDKNFLSASETTFRGVIAKYGTRDANGFLDLAGTCKSAGLGGTPYRDGSLEYYASEPQHVNDMKALGPLLLAAIELENAGLNLTTISK